MPKPYSMDNKPSFTPYSNYQYYYEAGAIAYFSFGAAPITDDRINVINGIAKDFDELIDNYLGCFREWLSVLNADVEKFIKIDNQPLKLVDNDVFNKIFNDINSLFTNKCVMIERFLSESSSTINDINSWLIDLDDNYKEYIGHLNAKNNAWALMQNSDAGSNIYATNKRIYDSESKALGAYKPLNSSQIESCGYWIIARRADRGGGGHNTVMEQ